MAGFYFSMHYFMGGILNRKGGKVGVGGVHFSNVCRRYYSILQVVNTPGFLVSLAGPSPLDG